MRIVQNPKGSPFNVTWIAQGSGMDFGTLNGGRNRVCRAFHRLRIPAIRSVSEGGLTRGPFKAKALGSNPAPTTSTFLREI